MAVDAPIDRGTGVGEDERVSEPSKSAERSDEIRRLLEEHAAIMRRNPQADPENIRHVLLLLRLDPLSRLNLSLTRGRAFAAYRT